MLEQHHTQSGAKPFETIGKKAMTGIIACSGLASLGAFLAAYIALAGSRSSRLWVALVVLSFGVTLALVANAFYRNVTDIVRDAKEKNLPPAADCPAAGDAPEFDRNGLLLNALLDHFPGHIYFKDTESRFITLSKSLISKFGASNADEIEGKTDFDFFTDEHARPAFEDEQKIIETGIPLINKEEKETWKDGNETWASTTKMPLRDARGQIIGTFGITIDITARKLAEENLLKSKALFDSVVNSFPQNIYCKDQEGKITFGNAALCEGMEQTLSQIIGKTDFDLFPLDRAEKNGLDDSRVMREGIQVDHVEEFVQPDGRKQYLHTVKTPTLDHKRRVIGVQSIFWDVTEQKMIENALARERDLLHALMDNIPDLIYFKDTSSRFTLINKAQARMLGLRDPDKAIGKTDFDFFEEEYSQSVFEDEQRMFKEGKALVGRLEKVAAPDGSRRWWMSTKVPIKDENGVITGLVGISIDVNERKEVEEALERALAEFQQVVSAVSQGDLTKRGTDTVGTLGKIVLSMNQMLDNFSSMLSKVKEMGAIVSSSAIQIQSASEQIAIGSQQQKDEITNTSVSMDQMATSMKQVSRHAEAAVLSSRKAFDMAERGGKMTAETYEAMKRIEMAVDQTSEKMRLLARSSTEISEIIDLINDISSQTNLLSLNAAIEAAHAGEAGLGFGVVAEEIRKLAERAARSTKDVSRLLKTIQGETDEALSAMEGGLQEVKNGSALAEQSRQTLQKISEVVRDSSGMIEEISAASDQQARVTAAVATAMQMILSITSQTSTSAQESARTIQSLASLAEQLHIAISGFKTSNGN